MKTPSKEQVAARIGWLLAELLVVFAGVYLAFWLVRQQAEAHAERRQQQLRWFDFGAGSINTNIWQVLLETGGVDALDIEFIRMVEGYFRSLRYATRHFRRAQELSNEFLLPNLGKGTEEFYSLDTKQLRPQYRWYPDVVTELDNNLRYIAEETDSLLVLLEERMGAGEAAYSVIAIKKNGNCCENETPSPEHSRPKAR